MKRLLSIIILAVCFTSCKKVNDDLLLESKPTAINTVTTENVEPIPAPRWTWAQLPTPTDIFDHVTSYNKIIEVNNKVYCLIGYGPYKMLYKFNSANRSWARSGDFSTYSDSQILFSYGSKVYVGISGATNALTNDFKSYDLVTGITTILPSFPGTLVTGSIRFVLGNKGYLIGGKTYPEGAANQCWEFNFSTNQWINKGNSPIGARIVGSAMVVGTKAYIGLGYNYLNINGQLAKIYKKDWVLYNPASVFPVITRTDFPGSARETPAHFILGDFLYVGLGKNGSGTFQDMYKYNPNQNSWTAIQDWPGNFVFGNDCEGFSDGDSGYIVSGALEGFWRYYNALFDIQ